MWIMAYQVNLGLHQTKEDLDLIFFLAYFETPSTISQKKF